MNVAGPRIARSDAALLLALAAVVLSMAVATLVSRGGSLDDRARAIEAQLRCPTCQGLSISDSPATSATQMRAIVREQLAAGASDDAVRSYFVARYGRWILLDPPLGGPDLALWFAPAVIVGVGSILVVRRARTRQAAGAARLWRMVPPQRTSRLPAPLLVGAMVLALAVPIAAAVGPRLAGREISGRSVPATAPTVEDLEAFVRAEPGDVDAILALGDALLEASRAGEAADRYRAALALDPENVHALLGIGTILLGVDRAAAAGPYFDMVLALSPDQPDALLYRAVARFRLEGTATEDVRRDLRRFLEVVPQDDPRRGMAASLLDGPAAPSPGAPTPGGSGGPQP